MKKELLTTIFVTLIAGYSCTRANADNTGVVIPMLPPTPIGSTTACPAGTQDVLSYSGAQAGDGQGGINCVPIATDAQGDMAASGYVQMSYTGVGCDGPHAGAIRFNPYNGSFEGCNGGNWQRLGGLPIQMYQCPTSYQLADGGDWASYGCIGQISSIPTCTNIVANPPHYPTITLPCNPI